MNLLRSVWRSSMLMLLIHSFIRSETALARGFFFLFCDGGRRVPYRWLVIGMLGMMEKKF